MARIIFIITAWLCIFPVTAEKFLVDGLYYYINEDSCSVTVTSENEWLSSSIPDEEAYHNLKGEVVIPETIAYEGKSYIVTKIGYRAFRSCDDITSVKIPNTVTSIEGAAFARCSYANIQLPSSVKYVGKYAFQFCNFSSLVLPASLVYIDDYAFYNCWKLTSVSFPASLTHIGEWAFYACSSLTTMQLPDSVEYIGAFAFYMCESLSGTLTIPETVTFLDGGAFAHCKYETIYYNARNARQGGDPFTRETIKNIIFGEHVEHIKTLCCHNLTLLTTINIPNSVKSIGAAAFKGCTGLESITFGEGLDSIAKDAFNECKNLRHLTYNAKNLRYIDSQSKFPADKIEQLTFGENVEYVTKGIAKSNNNLTSVVIPDKVKEIGNDAFSGCNNLTSVKFGKALNVIGDNAFNSCTELASLDLPSSLTTIGNGAFCFCFALTSLTVPTSVTTIGKNAFLNCWSLTSIALSASVKTIGDNAFTGCYALTSISVAPGNTVLDSRDDCNAIIETATGTLIRGCNSTVIPGTIRAIYHSAFEGCKEIEQITLPATLTSIGKFAFGNCSGLTKITCHARRPPIITGCAPGNYTGTFQNVNLENVSLYVPESSLELYWVAEGWGQFANIFTISDIPEPTQPCDVNGDGKVDIADVNAVINAMLNKQ